MLNGRRKKAFLRKKNCFFTFFFVKNCQMASFVIVIVCELDLPDCTPARTPVSSTRSARFWARSFWPCRSVSVPTRPEQCSQLWPCHGKCGHIQFQVAMSFFRSWPAILALKKCKMWPYLSLQKILATFGPLATILRPFLAKSGSFWKISYNFQLILKIWKIIFGNFVEIFGNIIT